MSESTNRDLVRAYELIEAEQLDEAQRILENYLATNKENADAWWLYAYAVTNPQDAQRALNNVLRINPDYPGAQELLTESQQVAAAVPTPSAGISRLGGQPEPSPDFLDRLDEDEDFDSLDDFDDEDVEIFDLEDDDDLDDFDDFDDEDLDEEPAERRQPNRLLLFGGMGLVLTLIIVAFIGVFFNRSQTEQTATPTMDVGVVASPTVLFNIDATPPIQPDADVSGVYAALAGVEVIEDSAVIEITDAGRTLLVSVCSGAGRQQLNTTLETVIPLIASQADALAASTDALGVRLVNCDDSNTVLRMIYVTTQDAQDFTNGTLSPEEFRRRRKAL